MNRQELTGALSRHGLTLPDVPASFGAYVPARRVGNLIFVAGQLPARGGTLLTTGPVGDGGVSLDDAQAAARQCVANGLAAALTAGEPTGVVRVGVFVQCAAGFADQPKVANGASELLVAIFGDAGRHARAAVGVPALPLNASIEIEFLFTTGGA